jgi:large subunit ribosomal protein L13
MILRGKYKPSYTPHVDCGDNVIVINSEKKLTGNKMDEKIYMRHTGYPGGQRTLTAKVLQSKPCNISRKSCKRNVTKKQNWC